MLAITDEILRMAHINGLYGSQRLHRLIGDEKGVIRIQRQIEKETDEWHELRERRKEVRLKMRAKVNIRSNFSKTILERVFDESVFIVRNDATLKFTAKKFGVSTTTVWCDMRKRLLIINPTYYRQVGDIIDSHKRR